MLQAVVFRWCILGVVFFPVVFAQALIAVLIAMKRFVSAILPDLVLRSVECRSCITAGLLRKIHWRQDRLVQFCCYGNCVITGLGVNALSLLPIFEILPICDQLIQSGRYRPGTLPI